MVLIYLIAISKEISLSIIKLSIMTYALLNIGAFTPCMHILCISKFKCLVSFLGWIILIFFSIYIYRYSNKDDKLYLWYIFYIFGIYLCVYG